MKYIFIIITTTWLCSCNNSTTSVSAIDTMNGINDRPLQDTVVAPRNDGYAPPNTDVDTSKYRKDSMQRRDSTNTKH